MRSRFLWTICSFGLLVEVYSSPLKGLVFVDSAQSPFLSTHQPTSEHPPASLPVSNPTKSFWINTPNANPLANEGSQGALTKEADVCVIGSGMAGISAVYHMANAVVGHSERKLEAVVLEAREFCSGATGRNGGHLTPYSFFNFRDYQSQFGTEQAVKSLELEMRTAREMDKILEDEGLEDKVDIVHGGHVGLISSEKAMRTARSNYEGAKEAGLNVSDVEWLSAEEVKEDYGAPYPAVKFTAHNFWPLKFVTQLYHLAKSKSKTSNFSVNLHTKTPVTAVKPIPVSSSSHQTDSLPRRWSLTTPRGPIQCSYVLHTTNAYASHLLSHLTGPAGIVPVRGQIIAVRAAKPFSELWHTSWGGVNGNYWFARPFNGTDGDTKEEPLVILGGGRYVMDGKGKERYVTDDSVVVEEVGEALREFLPSVFEGMFEEGKEPEMEWTGIMGYTSMGDPFVGPVFDKSQDNEDLYAGQFIAAGFSGHGMPRAFSSAEAVAGIILSEITGEEWIQPSWLPDRYLTWNRGADGW
ncbi:DAO-domain-containing protein [Dendrothele bispora CBS 962.96]|uniref:DAO-domain-containing protein n=1 Tax=Dendrothele bispora (strain CBS 962.96) TaxID=1314807 RepID=A0A4S8M711_DENBC|nr:DAO-domain-containing protein [Dendrothele bispora CBS 962.96]